MEGASRLKDILKVIAEHRVARGWTEYQLAEHAGLPQSTAFCGGRDACVFDKIAVCLIGPLVPLDRGTAKYNISVD